MIKANLIRIAGVDEAGRGPLAGPVIAAAVLLNPEKKIAGIADSKKLSAQQRERLYHEIVSYCVVGIGRAEVEEIDTINILQATFLAMERAVNALAIVPDEIYFDGPYVPKQLLGKSYKVQAIINGDDTHAQISAASIVAKVTRDREMIALDQQFPGYGFAAHKGYGTENHLAALTKLGACPIHRRSFAPVAEVLLK